jgi:hypothetical protein
MGNSKCSFTSSEIPHVYDLERSEIYGVPHRILQDTGTKHFKALKLGLSRENGNESDPYT